MESNPPTIPVQGVSLFLRDEGEGPPLLLLHGMFDSAIAWDAAIARLKKRFRCLAPDLPGFGRSKAPEDFDCSLPHLAQFVDKILDAAQVTDPVSLVMHGIGGAYGLAWAVSHPHNVSHLAILNTSFFSDHQPWFWSRNWQKPMIGPLALAMLTPQRFEKALQTQYPNLSREYIHQTAEFLTPASKKMATRWLAAMEPQIFRGWETQLRDLTHKTPAMVFWADRDEALPSPLAEKFGTNRIVHFPDNGPWFPAEAGDILARHLRDFLTDAEEIAARKKAAKCKKNKFLASASGESPTPRFPPKA